MYHKKKFVVFVALMVVITVFVSAQPTSYEEFFADFMEKKGEMLSQDGVLLGQLMDRWENDEITQTEVVAEVEEMESRAESYFAEILELRAPEGEFEKYRRSIYSFVTWYNIIGMFTDGLTDMNIAKLDAASTLMSHLEEKIETFEVDID